VGDELQQQQPARVGGGTMNRGSVLSNSSSQGDDMMSEMARRLQERRAKTDQAPPGSNNVRCYLLLFLRDQSQLPIALRKFAKTTDAHSVDRSEEESFQFIFKYVQ